MALFGGTIPWEGEKMQLSRQWRIKEHCSVLWKEEAKRSAATKGSSLGGKERVDILWI